jgi:hypothetical protein
LDIFTSGLATDQWGMSNPATHSLAHLMMENCYPHVITSPHSIVPESPSSSLSLSPSGSPGTKESNTAAIIGGSVGGAAAIGCGAAAFFVLRRKFGQNKVANNLENDLDVDADADDDDSSDPNHDFETSDDE